MQMTLPASAREPAERLFDWLRASDPLPRKADAIVGFGHFDLRVPRTCGELARSGLTGRVIFTGGVGAGSAGLGAPEADVFAAELARDFPEIAGAGCLTENRSTNTSENIRFTRSMLERAGESWAFGGGTKSAVLVAHPARLRRVRQTWRKLAPEVVPWAVAPATDFASDFALHRANGSSLVAQILGEMERILTYPAKGWIEPVEVPRDIGAALGRLRVLAEA